MRRGFELDIEPPSPAVPGEIEHRKAASRQFALQFAPQFGRHAPPERAVRRRNSRLPEADRALPARRQCRGQPQGKFFSVRLQPDFAVASGPGPDPVDQSCGDIVPAVGDQTFGHLIRRQPGCRRVPDGQRRNAVCVQIPRPLHQFGETGERFARLLPHPDAGHPAARKRRSEQSTDRRPHAWHPPLTFW